jgi:hypothetical protein
MWLGLRREGVSLGRYAAVKQLLAECGWANAHHYRAPVGRIPYRDRDGGEATLRCRNALREGSGRRRVVHFAERRCFNCLWPVGA